MVNTELIWHIYTQTIPAAFSLLPGKMDSREAKAMMLAIGLQESEFKARVQGGGGPARGFWQFEKNGGVKEILSSASTGPLIRPICKMFLFEPTPASVHPALACHDVLAACFARLLLWVDPRPMPSPIETLKGWDIYISNWRPGKPHPTNWPANFEHAWQIVKGS